MFKVIIAGSRHFNDYKLLEIEMDILLFNKKDVEVVSGKCKTGADYLGEQYAKSRGWPVKPFPADWNKHGKAAGPIRNKEMAEYADACVVFWDGKSKGSEDMVKQAKNKKLLLSVVAF